MCTRMRWLMGLILGAFCAPSATWADVRLHHSLGNWSVGPCDTPHYGQFEFGDSISSSCSGSAGGESHSVSIQESSSIVMGSHGVDSMTMSVTINLQAMFEGASGSLDLSCGLEVTTPTPFTLSVQPSMGGQVEGRVKFDAGWNGGEWDGCECVGSYCAGPLGCEPGQGNLLLQGVLQPGIEHFYAFVYVQLEGEQDFEVGSANLTFSISFNRTSTTYNWVNQSGGDYSVATNWSPQGVPTHDAQVSDTAIFGAPGLYAVNAVGAKAGRFVIRQADVALVGDAQVFETTGSPASLEVEGDASFQLYGGSSMRAVHGAVGIGAPAGATDDSAILMDDAPTLLVFSGNLTVGQDMPGLVAIDGGFLQAADLLLGGAARGRLDIDGSNAAALVNDVFVGSSQGVGIAHIAAGGLLNIGNMEIGGNRLTDPVEQVTNTVEVAGRAANSTPSRLLATGDIRVGEDGWGEFNILDGGYVEAGGSVTLGAGRIGNALVKSSDPTFPSILRAGSLLQIGEDSLARITIEPGGQVEASDVRLNFGGLIGGGELIVDGQGTSNTARMKVTQALGVGGDPRITPVFVKNGGVLTARSATIGNDVLLTDEAAVLIGTFGGGDTASAEFNVVDPGSAQLTGGGVTVVGGAGPGRLGVSGGAIARLSGGLMIGDQADGAVEVDSMGSPAGLRSTAIVNNGMVVGNNGLGDLAISNGGLLTSDSDILVSATSFGEIRVFNGQGFAGERAELRMTGSELQVGAYGIGELNVQGSGLAQCARLVVGGTDFGAAGEVLVDTGGEIDCLADMLVGAAGLGTGSVTVGPAGTLVVDGVLTVGGTSEGLIALTDATARVSAGILSGASTFVKNHGSIVGVGTLATTSLIVAPGGFVSPGLSPGTLTIDGDYEQQQGATLIIEVAGLEPGRYDVLKVTGHATLAGKIQLKFIDGFVPRPGDTIDCLQIRGTTTGQLPVETLGADGQPVQVGGTVQFTPEGLLRLVASDDTAGKDDDRPPSGDADSSASQTTTGGADADPAASACGGGACGAGVMTMLPLSLVMVRRRRAGEPQ